MSPSLTTPTSTTSTSPRRSGARTRSAVLVAAGVALSAVLTGCGSDGGDDTASDPAASSSTTSPAEDATTETPTETPTETTPVPESGSGGQETIEAVGSAGVTEATLLSATEGGGSASTLAMALDTDQARADFVAQLEGGFAATVGDAAAQAAQQAPGSTPYGAIVAIGCDAPRGVAIEAGEAGFEAVPRLPKNGVECLAPVTYVVLFTVPDA